MKHYLYKRQQLLYLLDEQELDYNENFDIFYELNQIKNITSRYAQGI